jgi:hypothetical protein
MMYEERDEKKKFPLCGKLGRHRNSHPIWYTPLVLDWFKRQGMPVPENVEFS